MRLFNIITVSLLAIMLIGASACGPKQTGNGDDTTATQDDTTATQNGDTSNGIDSENENETDQIAEGDENLINEPTNGGHVSIIRTDELPEQWPDDVPIMDGLTIIQYMEAIDMDDQNALIVSTTGDVPLDEIEKFYSNLPRWGDQEPEVVRIGEDELIIAFEEDNIHFSFNARVENGETLLDIQIVTDI